MENIMIIRVLCVVLSLSFTSGESRDAIRLLASCGAESWKANNTDVEKIETGTQIFDNDIIKAMQLCFHTKTNIAEEEKKLNQEQILKIKVSAYCGYVCFNNNKDSKKSLDYCYVGCLGTILQPKLKSAQNQVNNGTQLNANQNQVQAPAHIPAHNPAHSSAQDPAHNPTHSPAHSPAHSSAQNPVQSQTKVLAQIPLVGSG